MNMLMIDFFFPILHCSLCPGAVFTNYSARNAIRCIAFENDTAWFGTDCGLLKRDISGNLLASYSTMDGLADNAVYTVSIDGGGNKWIGTAGGVSRFNGTGWTTFGTADGLAANGVFSVAIDGEGTKWFGSFGLGVSMLVASSETGVKDETAASHCTTPEYSLRNSGKSIVIRYRNKTTADVTLSLYNILGKCIRKVTVREPMNERGIEFGIAGISNGNYLLSIRSKTLNATEKITIIR